MTVIERNIVLVSKDSNGNTTMDFPLTTASQVEGLEEVIAGKIPEIPKVEIATSAEATTGSNDTKMMTPKKVKQVVDAAPYVHTDTVGNAANKIPKYNAEGHLVLPNGSEFWIG